jgi:hypothetical protein
MKIMKKIIRLTESDLNRIVRRVINESDEKTIDDNKIVKTIDDSKITKKIKGSLGANGGRFLFQVHTKLKTGGFAFLHPDYNKNKKLVFIPIDELGTGLPMVGTWLIDGTKLTLKES